MFDLTNIKPAAMLLGIAEEDLRKKFSPETSTENSVKQHNFALSSAQQLQKDFCVSYATLRRAILRNELRPTKIGRRLLFHPADIEIYLNSKRGLKRRVK